MSEEINFLPEKDKEKKEKEQVKKTTHGVAFHTPSHEDDFLEVEKSDNTSTTSFKTTITALWQKVFPKKKVTLPETVGKKPVKLAEKKSSRQATNKIKQPPSTASLGNRVTTKKTEPISTASLANAVNQTSRGFSQVDVNLMPWQDPLLKRARIVRVVAIVGSLLVVGVWGTMLRIENKKTGVIVADLQNQIQQVDADLIAVNQELQGRADIDIAHQQAFISLYTSLPRWSKLFTWLESITHQQIFYTNMSASTGQITLPVIAPDYAIAIQQWLAFRNETNWTENVVTSAFKGGNTAGSETDGISENIEYTISFSLVKDVLLLTEDDL